MRSTRAISRSNSARIAPASTMSASARSASSRPRRSTADVKIAAPQARRRVPRARPHQVVVHGRRVRADRQMQARPFGRNHVVPKAPWHVQQIARFEHAVEHRRRRARRTAPLAPLHVERQRQRRWINAPALAPDQLERKHVVRVPVLTERAAPADRKIRVTRGLQTAEITHLIAQRERAQRVILEAIDDERRTAAQLDLEATLAEPPARRAELGNDVGEPLLTDRSAVEKLQHRCDGSTWWSAASSSDQANGSPRSARFTSRGSFSRVVSRNSSGVWPKSITGARRRLATRDPSMVRRPAAVGDGALRPVPGWRVGACARVRSAASASRRFLIRDSSRPRGRCLHARAPRRPARRWVDLPSAEMPQRTTTTASRCS